MSRLKIVNDIAKKSRDKEKKNCCDIKKNCHDIEKKVCRDIVKKCHDKASDKAKMLMLRLKNADVVATQKC